MTLWQRLCCYCGYHAVPYRDRVQGVAVHRCPCCFLVREQLEGP